MASDPSSKKVAQEKRDRETLERDLPNVFPPGSIVRATPRPAGRTRKWCVTGRVNGAVKCYFIKVWVEETFHLFGKCMCEILMIMQGAINMTGRELLEGQAATFSALAVPGEDPPTSALHLLSEGEAVHTYLVMDYVGVTKTLPEAPVLCSYIATIHKSVSPEPGHFGFATPSYLGTFSIPTQWERSWATFFKNMLQRLAEAHSESWHMPQLKNDPSFEILLSKTVPALLEPLQAGGRSIEPCLVHGNLSEKRIGINMVTGEPFLFGFSSLYAHNEFELGMWRRGAGRLSRGYLDEYKKHFPPSEPNEQWDDRIRLYSIYFNLAYVLEDPGTQDVQDQ